MRPILLVNINCRSADLNHPTLISHLDPPLDPLPYLAPPPPVVLFDSYIICNGNRRNSRSSRSRFLIRTIRTPSIWFTPLPCMCTFGRGGLNDRIWSGNATTYRSDWEDRFYLFICYYYLSTPLLRPPSPPRFNEYRVGQLTCVAASRGRCTAFCTQITSTRVLYTHTGWSYFYRDYGTNVR